MLYYVLFFSLDQPVAKNQKLNSKWSLDKARTTKMLWTELYLELSPDGGLELVFLLLWYK